jgi:hypothetical protein
MYRLSFIFYLLGSHRTRLSVPGHALPKIRQQPGWRNAQSTCNLHDVQQTQVTLAALNPAYVGPMQIGFLGQTFL